MDINFLDTKAIAYKLLFAFLASEKMYDTEEAEAYITLFECKLANVYLWMKQDGIFTIMWIEVSSSTDDGGHSKSIKLQNSTNEEVERVVKELLSYIRVWNFILDSEYLDNSLYCPMCGTKFYKDSFCPLCKELVS
mgnify:CR=1 FL=1